jgi:ferredoxin
LRDVYNPLVPRADGSVVDGSSGRPTQQPRPGEAPWQTLVLVCTNCKGSRRGPDAREIRKGLKQRLGKTKQLRVLESDCMSVCPDDAITVCIARTRGTTEVRLVQSHDELDGLASLVQD